MLWCIAVYFGNNTFMKNREKDVSFYKLTKDLKSKK